jgi:hypothetical protein
MSKLVLFIILFIVFASCREQNLQNISEDDYRFEYCGEYELSFIRCEISAENDTIIECDTSKMIEKIQGGYTDSTIIFKIEGSIFEPVIFESGEMSHHAFDGFRGEFKGNKVSCRFSWVDANGFSGQYSIEGTKIE